MPLRKPEEFAQKDKINCNDNDKFRLKHHITSQLMRIHHNFLTIAILSLQL
jgi:hypothetical protein